MNILDTFYFMFEADASKVQKGADTGKDSADKLKKSLDAADLSADKLAKNFVNMAKNAAGALAGVLALGAIKSLVNDTAAHTAQVALQARAMGQSVEAMTAYSSAVRAVGGDGDAAAETLGKLRDRFVEMSRFGAMMGPDAFMFKQLGLSAQQMQASIKDPTIALGALADKFQTLNQTQQLYIGKKLGLDQGTIMLLQQGRRAFDEMIQKQRELHAVTEAQAQQAIKYKIAQNELSMTFETVRREITTALLPAFTAIVTGIDNAITWFREHKAVAIAVFGAIGVVVATLLVPPLVTAAAAMWALIAPILAAAAPFIALGVAIGLIIDDIEKFRSGQKSLIGEILNRWPIIGQTARAVSEIVQMAFKLIVDSFRWLGGIISGEASKVWQQWKDGAVKAFDELLKKFPAIGNAFKVLVDGWKSGVSGLNDMFKTFVDLISKLWDMLKNAPVRVLNWIGNGLAKLTHGHYDNIGDSTPAPSQPEPAAVARLGNTATGKDIADKLVASGKWTREQAAGIAGSFMQESQGKSDARNPTSGAYGLGQWLGSRRKDFEQYSGKALEGSSLDEQLAFFNYETEHKEKRAGDMIRKAQTASEAADAHAKYYERPGANEINLARREAYAASIYNGQQAVAATNTPLASAPPVSRPAASRTVQVTTGDVNIHTPSADPQAHAAAFNDHLKKHFNDALDYHDDGVLG